MSRSPEENIAADQIEFNAVRKRLVRAYRRKAHWENRILRSRREIEVIINKINGHLSTDQHLDYEQFLPPNAQLTSSRYITGTESIRLISDLRGSLDMAKLRINALLDENFKLKARLCEHGRDLKGQVSRLDRIIRGLVRLQSKEKELAKLDEELSLHAVIGHWSEDEDGGEQEAVEAQVEVVDAPDGDMEMVETESEDEEKSNEQGVEECSGEPSDLTITPPPSFSLHAAAGTEDIENCSQ